MLWGSYVFSSLFLYIFTSCILVLWPPDIHCTYIWFIYILMYVIHLYFHVLFLFFLYTHVSYLLYVIYYFYFTLRCLEEFWLKYFRNTGCQSLLGINSLLAKFFKSFCYDSFYCISTSEYELSDLWLLSYVYLFIVVLSRIVKGGDC